MSADEKVVQLDDYRLEEEPKIVRLEDVIDPETGYVPLPFYEARCEPGQKVWIQASCQVHLKPHYKLLATMRDDHGEYLGFRILDIRIGNLYMMANFVEEGVETFDEIKDSLHPSLKECIPLHGPCMQPGNIATLVVRNLANRTGVLSATLYATPFPNYPSLP